MKKRENIFPVKFVWLTAFLLIGVFSFILSKNILLPQSVNPSILYNNVEILGPERICLVTGNKIEEFLEEERLQLMFTGGQ